MKVNVLPKQSLLDLAIQLYGSAEGVVALALENGLSVTDRVDTPGRQLDYSPRNIIDKRMVQHYTLNGIRPATQADNRTFDHTFDLTFN